MNYVNIKKNWRQVRSQLKNRRSLFHLSSVLNDPKRFDANDLTLILKTVDDVKEIRDWLEENANGRYIMGTRHRIYSDNSNYLSLTCIGMVVQFQNEVDAVHFRLRWNADVI